MSYLDDEDFAVRAPYLQRIAELEVGYDQLFNDNKITLMQALENGAKAQQLLAENDRLRGLLCCCKNAMIVSNSSTDWRPMIDHIANAITQEQILLGKEK